MADSEYLCLYRRAETELDQAQRARHAKAAAANHQFAETYLERAALLANDGPIKRESA